MRIMYCVVALMLLNGCATTTPTNQIAAFGEATSQITEHVDTVMQEYNESSVARQITDYAATYKGQFAARLTLEQLAKISQPITPTHRQQFAIYRANKVLGHYASALGALASAGTKHQVDLASADLYGAFIGLNDQYKLLKGDDVSLFDNAKLATVSTLIAQIGSVVVEEKRRAAIKDIVLAANGSIGVICDEIIAQLSNAGIADGIALSRQHILREQLIEYKALAKKNSSKLKWRTQELSRLHELQQQVFTSKLLVQRSVQAIKAVKAAHQILSDEVAKDRFNSSELSQTIGRLKALDKHYDDFEQMLLTCAKIFTDEQGVLSCE